jgi:hypothetical protein
MKFQEATGLPSPNFTVSGTGERFVANPKGQLIAVPENVAHALSREQNFLNLTTEQIGAISDEIVQELPFGLALVPVLEALGFTRKYEAEGILRL